MPRARQKLLLAVLISLSACKSANQEVRAPTVHDSAGITIVANSADPGYLQQWSVSPLADLIVGTIDEHETDALHRVAGARRLSDERIAIANAGGYEIKYFSTDGRFLLASGGEGSGPGEFRSLDRIVSARADTIVAYDTQLSRLTVLGPEGEFVRTIPLPSSEDVRFPQLIGIFDDGTQLLRSTSSWPSTTGVFEVDYSLLRYDASAESMHSLGEFRGDQRYFRFVNGGVSVYGVPFGRSYSVVVADSLFFLGHNDHPEVRVYSAAGQLSRLIRWGHSPSDVTDEELDEHRSMQLNRARNPQLRARWAEVLSGIPAAGTIPAFGRSHLLGDLPALLCDGNDNLWVLEYAWRPNESTWWTVFDPGGAALARVELPPRHEPLHVGSDFVLLLYRDSLDVETVRLHDLRRSGQ